jgi:hypothetical protein
MRAVLTEGIQSTEFSPHQLFLHRDLGIRIYAPPAACRPVLAAAGSTSAVAQSAPARKALGWPKRCKLTHAFLWEYCYKRLKFAQRLGQLGVFLTCPARV